MKSGSQAISDVFRLMATVLVLFRIFEWQVKGDPFSLDTIHFKELLHSIFPDIIDGIPHNFYSPLVHAARFCEKIDSKYPLIYSRLNIGRSWPEAAVNLLGKNARSCRA